MPPQLRAATQLRIASRRYATNAGPPPPPPLAPGNKPRPVVIVPPTTTPNALPPPPGIGLPPSSAGPKRRPVRKFILYTSLLTLGFYGFSGLASQHSEAYREFFTNNIPGGEGVVNYADENDWDRVGWGSVSKKGLQTVDYVKGRFGEGNVPANVEQAKGVKDSWKAKAGQALNDAKLKASNAVDEASKEADKASIKGNTAAHSAEQSIESTFNDAKTAASNLASKAEASLRDASASAQGTAETLKAKAERVAAELRAKAEGLADDVKARAGVAMTEAEKKAHEAQEMAVKAGKEVKSKAYSAMTQAERAAHDAEAQALSVGRDVKDKAYAAMSQAERAAHDAQEKVLATGRQVKDSAEQTAHEAENKAVAAGRDLKNKAYSAMSTAERAAHDAQERALETGREVKDKAYAAMTQAERAAHDSATNIKKNAEAATTQAERSAHDAEASTLSAARDVKERAAAAAHDARVQAEQIYADAKAAAANTKDKISTEARNARQTAVAKAEHALREAERKAEHAAQEVKNVLSPPEASRNSLPDTARPRELRPETVKPKGPSFEGLQVYNGPPLPLGHEPPPGYYIPPPITPKSGKISGTDKSEGVKPTLPLLSPKVKEFASAADEPIIAQLAGTIDSLAASLHNAEGPNAASPSTILTKAQTDLTSLSTRLQSLKDEERLKLEKTVEEKKKAFEGVLREKQSEWQGKQEHLKESWEAEREKLVSGWRKVLDGELESQRQGIEKRLREEVISQGIELQRRWLRSIKTQVEQERGGRLSKLDTLSSNLKHLERITLDNSTQLDDNVRLHKLWSALRAVQAKADRGNQRFDDELRVLKAVIGSADADADKVISAAVDNVEKSGAAQTGVKSMPSLSSWFTQTVSPRIHSVSLVPTEEGQAGVLSHLSSIVLSKILFRPQPSLVKGDDVNAVLARAEFYLAEKDLDAAAREVNQLKGWPAKLAADWLREARRRLEVQQALDIVATEATLSSLLLV